MTLEGVADEALEQHRRIFEAIVQHDGDLALSAMQPHLDAMYNFLRKSSDRGYEVRPRSGVTRLSRAS